MTTFSKDQIEKMRRRNERRKERRELRDQPPESSGGLVGKYLVPALQSEPVQKYILGPARGAAEEVQRVGEFKEAYEQGGTGNLLKHWGREVASDVLDIGADVSRGLTPGSSSLIPESWGERVDPSSNTELGALVETDKERFRKEHGRNPSMIEEYDIMTSIQDAKFPWLTERHKIGPVEFSNRMLVELPVEIGVAALETGLTVGTAAVAKQAAKYGIKSTVKTTAAQTAKQKTIRAAAVATEQALLIPKRIDDLMGAMITMPLKLGAKGVVLPVKITKRVLIKTINQFRRKAQEEGMPMNQVNDKAKETWEKAVNEGHVEDVPPNTQLRFADFFDEDIDAPKIVPEREVAGATGRSVQESLDEINRLGREANETFTRARQENVLPQYEMMDMAMAEGYRNDIPKIMGKLVRGQELASDELLLWNKYKANYTGPEPLSEGGRLRKQQIDIVEEAQASAGQQKGAAGQDNVMGIPDAPPISHRFSTTERISDTVKMVSKPMSDAAFNINEKLHQAFDWIPVRTRREGATAEQTSHKRLANDIRESNKDYIDGVENRIEAATAGVGSRINHAISYLGKTWPGLIKTNVGGAGSRTKKRFDLDVDAMAARGELIDDLLEGGSDEYNFIVSDDWFKSQNINKTVTGHTLISQTTKEKMSAGVVKSERRIKRNPEDKEIIDWIAVNLEPGFADVAERLDKYEDALRAVIHEVTEEVSIAGNIYRPGDTINAYDIIKSIADEVTVYEDQLIRDGVAGAGQAIGVTRRYFPHNVLAGEITESGKLPQKGIQEIDLNVNPDIPSNYWGAHSIKQRQFLSQAEGMLNNRVYYHPAQAAASQVQMVGEHIRNQKLGKWISQVATENNMTHGTLKELMWKTKTGRSLFEAITKIRYELQKVGNRQMRAKMARQPHLIGKASEMLGRRVDLETGRIISDTGEVIAEGQQLGFGDLDLTLPFNLRGASPKMGSKTPRFESDLDKVLYIIRGKKKVSAGESGYFEWLESLFPGVSRQQFRDIAESVRASVVKLSRNVAEGNDIEVPISITEGNVNMADELTKLSREALGEDDVSRLIADMETSIEFQPKLTPDDAGGDAIEAELKRLREDIIKWGKDVDNLAAKNLLRDQEEKALKTQLKALDASYERLKKEVTQDMGQLTGIHLEGHYFPRVFYDEIRRGLQEDVQSTKEPIPLLKTLMLVNSFLRTTGATADLSGFGIQGWTAVMNDVFDLRAKYLKKNANGQVSMRVHRVGPGFSALRASFLALGRNGEAITTEFFNRHEVLAVQFGLPTPTQAAQEGLAILAHAPDIMEVGRGIPLLKNFDRAFTHYGNMLRYDLFIQEIEEAMLKTGQTSKQLLDAGYGREVSGALNAMTGVGRRGFGGKWSQFLLFAPRFFEARLRFATDSLKGTVKRPLGKVGITEKATIQEQVSSRRLAKFIGTATFLTFMINEGLGEETDINPFIRNPQTGQWSWNSNFMRVHAGQLDISLFSSFDSFMRFLATPVLMGLNRMSGDDIKGFSDQLQGLISAPGTSVLVDVGLGRDAMGRETRSSGSELNKMGLPAIFDVLTSIGSELLDHTVPFSWNEFLQSDPGQQSILQRTFEGMDDVVTGDVVEGTGDIAAGAGQTVLQVVGSKSAYESISETMNEVYAEVLNLGPANVELQEAFGMTEQELRDYLADKGRGVLNDNKGFDYSISFRNMIPAWANETPSWTQIASDYQKNIKKKLEDSVFQNIMSAEEAKQVEARIQERVEASAEPYSKYQIARDEINDAEQESMQVVVDEFFKEDSLDFSGLLKNIRLIRKDRGDERRDLLEGDHAPFKGLKEDLFDFGRTSALGNLSSADADVYDYAQAHYYDLLYGVDGIIDGNTKQVDWNKRDAKMSEWATDMDERYPHLSSAEVLQYRLRIEKSARKDAPPVAQQLFEMSRMISDSKYYELEEESIRSLLPKVGRYDAAENLRLYKHWQTLNSKARDNFILEDRKGRLWLDGLRSFSAQRTREYLKTNPDIDALIQITGDYNRVPQTDRGTDVKAIIQKHNLKRRRMDQDEIARFLDDVITGKDLTKYKELPPLTMS